MNALTFSHVAISCKDPLIVEQFYTRHFGFKRARVVPLGEDQIVFIKVGDVYLELFRATTEATVPLATGTGPEYPGWRHIAFMVDDIDAKLAAMGDAARITLGPVNFDDFIRGWRTVWIADPEGNIVEISQGYSDQENPPPAQFVSG
jgi:glyoxylase I family protein